MTEARYQLGVVFPQTETNSNADAIDEYIAGVVDAGYDHVLAYEHVLGAQPSDQPGRHGPYTHLDPFQDPLTLFAYMAGRSDLAFITGVIVLPQRQTVLVAKQAAQVDILCRGRLRLGVGVGWNRVEYEAMGFDYSTRGARIEEQITLLRQLWTDPLVTFNGRNHTVDRAGLLPRPIQQPIPVWMAAGSNPVALERAGRLADGILPMSLPGPRLEEACRIVRESARRAGRDPHSIGMQGMVQAVGPEAKRITELTRRWLAGGATHVAVDTMGGNLRFPDGHVEALRRAADELRDMPSSSQPA